MAKSNDIILKRKHNTVALNKNKNTTTTTTTTTQKQKQKGGIGD